MKVAVFSARPYDREFLDAANSAGRHDLAYHDARLTSRTVALARGHEAVCVFANDKLDRCVIEQLARAGIRMIALRAAGFNNVDLKAAREFRIAVGRVPSYSPHAVAEHTFALLLALVRKIHRAHNRVREGNFSLEGLLGFDLAGKTIGIVGAGNIGSVVARIALGFGCQVLASDPCPREECEKWGVRYRSLDVLLSQSDIVTLHCPLDETTRHLIGAAELASMKSGAILVNTSRGAVVDTHAVIDSLKRGQLGGLAIDVYEKEEELFFEDRSSQLILDDQFVRLQTFPNVLVTGHQGFFTAEALANIAKTTIANLDEFVRTGSPLHPVGTPACEASVSNDPQQYVMH